FRIQSKPVTSALVAQRIMRSRLHCPGVDGRDTSLRVLHNDVEHAFAVSHSLFRHATQIDRAEHGALFGIDHRRVLCRVTENVDSVIEASKRMPSGAASPTSMVLINFIVLVSNMDTGLLLVKPWPDFGSTAVPFPPTPSISPTGSSVSRLKIVSRVGTATAAGLVSVAATAAEPRRGMYNRRPATSAYM